jgi:hypothetical protein
MSEHHLAPSSPYYRAELARNIVQWIPQEQLLPPGSASGYVSVSIYRFHTEGLDFVLKDPTGKEDVWSITWRGLLAFGALKQSSN